jgi:glycosyltransferase involved in cell wall biosynthesis
MPDLYRSADLFLHTKIRESFGNVYVEALSCGAKIVAHDDEVTRWILGNYATLVDTESRADLTRAIANVLEAPATNEAGAEWAHARYSWDIVAGKYVDFFDDVLNRRGRSATPELATLSTQETHA